MTVFDSMLAQRRQSARRQRSHGGGDKAELAHVGGKRNRGGSGFGTTAAGAVATAL
jgi:hypothetical protein